MFLFVFVFFLLLLFVFCFDDIHCPFLRLKKLCKDAIKLAVFIVNFTREQFTRSHLRSFVEYNIGILFWYINGHRFVSINWKHD